MDVYTFLFIISTLWVGPYWFAMILKPYDAKTSKLMSKPFFFMGPIIIWFLVMIRSPLAWILVKLGSFIFLQASGAL